MFNRRPDATVAGAYNSSWQRHLWAPSSSPMMYTELPSDHRNRFRILAGRMFLRLRLKLRPWLSSMMGQFCCPACHPSHSRSPLFVYYHHSLRSPLSTDLRRRFLPLISLPLAMLLASQICTTFISGSPTRCAHRTHGGAKL
jgi:hypothetical protein